MSSLRNTDWAVTILELPVTKGKIKKKCAEILMLVVQVYSGKWFILCLPTLPQPGHLLQKDKHNSFLGRSLLTLKHIGDQRCLWKCTTGYLLMKLLLWINDYAVFIIVKPYWFWYDSLCFAALSIYMLKNILINKHGFWHISTDYWNYFHWFGNIDTEKERWKERGRERESINPLNHSLNTCKSQSGWC